MLKSLNDTAIIKFDSTTFFNLFVQ